MLGKILINTLRVFTNESGEYGNPLGVIVDDGQNIDAITRQRIAAKLNFSETVFINNKYTGEISIYNPQTDVDFA
ncbi:PhzF family phenazine biosynthesis protein, partial [candidate division WWE3 bacterium]|nr:PhzF family phenazine biosynthesis protein [candidate division WWE3 bacterium]